MKYLAAYLVTLSALAALDFLWLGLVAKKYYALWIGHLLAAQPDMATAMLFYALFACGLVLFAVVPGAVVRSWRQTLSAAALYGFFTYITYELTNLATLHEWPPRLAVLDIGWGMVMCGGAAASGRLAVKWALPRR